MKKILFILLSIFCFIGITNAKDYENIKLTWEQDLDDLVYHIEEVDNNLITITSRNIYKVSKDGKKTEIYPNIKGDIQEFITKDNEYFFLTYTYDEENGITYYLYVLNEKYEVEHSDSIYTGNLELEAFYDFNGELWIGGAGHKIINIDDNYKMVKPNEDSNGNYTIVSNNKIIKIDKDNKVIREIKNLDYATKIDDYYYALTYESVSTGYDITISEYNSALEIVNTKTLNVEDYPYSFRKENEAIYFYVNSDTYKIAEDLSLTESTMPPYEDYEYCGFYSIKEKDKYELYNKYESLVKTDIDEEGYFGEFDYKIKSDGSVITAGIFESQNNENFSFISLYDKNDKNLLYKKIYIPDEEYQNGYRGCSGYNIISDIIGNNIYVVYNKDEDADNFILEVFDLQGNMIDSKKINNPDGSYPYHISETKNGLIIVVDNSYPSCPISNKNTYVIQQFLNNQRNNIPTLLVRPAEKSTLYYYEFPYNITTKSDDNGTITATKVEALSGEVIEYEVKPKEGYVLGEVKVIDEYGNVITFTNNKFTMPSANVTIEATFVVENVDTADIAICTILILGLIGVFFIVSNKTKINYINN